LRFKLA
jgi:hypothetical protein